MLQRTPPSRRLELLVYALLMAGSYVLAYDGNLDGNLDFYHEGDRLAHIDALFDGKLPFRDIYVQQGFGENILKPALACKLFGTSVESLRRLGQNSYIYRGYLPPLGLVATVLAAVVLLRRPGLVAGVCLLLLLSLYEVTERHAFGFLSIACLAAFIQSRRRWWLVLAGVMGSLAAIYSLEVGLFVMAAGIGWILLDARLRFASVRAFSAEVVRRGLPFVVGVLLGFAPFFLWCLSEGIVGDFVSNVHTQLFMRGEVAPAPYPLPTWLPHMPVGENSLFAAVILLIYYGIPCTYIAALLLIVYRRRHIRAKSASRILLTSLLGLFFWSSVVFRPDFWHVAYVVGPFILFLATCLDVLPHIIRNGRLRWTVLTIQVLTIFALIWLGQRGAVGRMLLGQESAMLHDDLKRHGKTLAPCGLNRVGHIGIEEGRAGFITTVVAYIQSHTDADDTILDLSDHALLYFLCKRKSPTRFHLLSHVGNTRLRDQLVTEVLSRERLPRYVIRIAGNVPSPDALGALVQTHYVPERRIGYLELLRCVDLYGHRHAR